MQNEFLHWMLFFSFFCVFAFKLMGAGFAHIAKPDFAEIATEVQEEVDRRWVRLKAKAESELL